MKTISLYDPNTGLFTGETKRGPNLKHLLRHVSHGLAAVEGEIDYRRCRMQLATGEVIDDPALAQLHREQGERRARRSFALEQIAELERKQLRPMRELAIDPGNADAIARLRELDDSISKLRAELPGVTSRRMCAALVALLLALTSSAGITTFVGSPRAFVAPPPGGGGEDCGDPHTALQIAACALAPGDDTQTIGANDGLSGLDSAAFSSIQWGNQFYYDDEHSTALLVGKEPSAGGGSPDPGARTNNLYTASTNTWASSGFFDIDGTIETGHVYESVGYDDDEQTLYVGRWNAEYIQTWTVGSPLTSGWGTTSTFAGHWMPDSTPQAVPQCWHPNLYGAGDGGLVIVRNVNQSTDMELLAWRESTDTYASVPGTQHDTTTAPQAGTCEYIRSGDYVIAGATYGNFYRLSAGSGGSLGTATQIADPPVDLRTGGSSTSDIGVLIDDPSGTASAYILEKGAATNRVWR